MTDALWRDADAFTEFQDSFLLSDDIDGVSRLNHIFSPGDNQFSLSDDCGNQNVTGNVQILYLHRIQFHRVVNGHGYHLHLALREFLHRACRRIGQHTADFKGGGSFGIDDIVNAELLFCNRPVLCIFRIPYPGHGCTGPQVFGGKTGQHVCFITFRNGYDHVIPADLQLLQGTADQTVGLHGQHIQVFIDFIDYVFVLFHDHNVEHFP